MPGTIERIDALLAEEERGLELLASVLQRERDALGAGLSEDLAGLAGEKERCAERLSRLGESRQALLAALGVLGGMAELLERSPEASSLRAAWQQVTDKARATHSLNREIGTIIGVHARQVHARLAALANATPAATYGRDGAARPHGTRRALGAA